MWLIKYYNFFVPLLCKKLVFILLKNNRQTFVAIILTNFEFLS